MIRDPEDFRGDYEQLAAVMRASWANAPNATYLYTAELLAECFRYPGATFTLAPAIYDGAELIAFAAGLPRRVAVGGAPRQILIATFVTVAAGHKSNGYGTAIWSELMRRAAAAGYDGVVTYCAADQTMQRIVERCGRAPGLPHLRAKSFSYLVRAMVPGPPAPGRGDGGHRPAPRVLMDAAERVPQRREAGEDRPSLHRMWTEPEAEWQLSRLGSVAVTSDDALVSGTVAAVDDAAGTRCLIVEDVLWGSLPQLACGHLVGELLSRAAAAGAVYAVVPQLGYADLRPFLAAGFLPAPHTMHANLTLWSDPDTQAVAESFYLDVI